MNQNNTEQIIENLHPSEIASYLRKVNKEDEDTFFQILHNIDDDDLGEVLLELPEGLRDKAYNSLSPEQISHAIEELETDDATDIIQDLEELDEQKADDILNSLDQEDRDDINWLKKYDEDEAGAYMQIELFKANIHQTVQEAVDSLKKLKLEGELENIHQLFIVDDDESLVASIPLEDLIIYDFSTSFEEIIKQNSELFKPIYVQGDSSIEEVVKLFGDYDLSVLAVVGYKKRLLGRITSDDIIDVVEHNATEQIYQLAGVNDESEQEESFIEVGKTRASWLLINLGTAILASFVIGFFDDVLKQYIALAVLMPIVASMGGNAGTQTLTVMVRQLALGDIDDQNSRHAIKKEIFISILNGILFAIILGVIASFWFSNITLGIVIGFAMIITLFCAGLFGSVIPLILRKLDIDPAIGSTVILTTVTDVMGFFSFLGLAKIFLIS